MKLVASLAILVALVACTSAVTIPGIFIVDNIVNFCAFETYLSQFTSKLSPAGKNYYDQAYHTWVQEMANQAGPIFANLVATQQNEVATLIQKENNTMLGQFGALVGYGQSNPQVGSGFNLCSYQQMLTSFVQNNFKTAEGMTAIRVIFNQFFINLIGKAPEIMAKTSAIMAPLYSTVPASDAQYFLSIGQAYGLQV